MVIWDYSKFIQYPIFAFILLYSVISFKNRVRLQEIILITILMLLGCITLFITIADDRSSSIKALLLPCTFYIIVNSNSGRLLRPLFIAS